MSITLTDKQLNDLAGVYRNLQITYKRQEAEIKKRNSVKGRNEIPEVTKEIFVMESVIEILNLKSEIKNRIG
jgi:hypothetical protein